MFISYERKTKKNHFSAKSRFGESCRRKNQGRRLPLKRSVGAGAGTREGDGVGRRMDDFSNRPIKAAERFRALTTALCASASRRKRWLFRSN
ncbi:hypothetical protein CDAR_55281 [Caerostris darwini]|uniref:Uncharacterized protein n=1 Tax=Caerostris darwini TaxID=1538125 RepID=A0AAV4R667_9ARAC|nr:hypothetical protein CDAR_55281 [Caerostris darwini]